MVIDGQWTHMDAFGLKNSGDKRLTSKDHQSVI